MKQKKVRLSKRGKYTIVLGLLAIVLLATPFLYFKFRPIIVFHHSTIELELEHSFEEPLNEIKKLRKGELEDVVVDTSQIDYTKVGEYPVIYTIDEKSYELTIKMVDKIAPDFEVLIGETDQDIAVSPENLVTHIIDQSSTSVALEEKYDFSQEGTIEVVVVVTDESNNSTKKTTTVHILPKDDIAPEALYEEKITLQQNASFDPFECIELKDNQDPKPKLEIVSNALNTEEIGDYKIKYKGRDRSGNEIKFTQTIEIVERKEIGNHQSNGENIVYLTFDDGPSYNTPKVLEILDHYQVKATFFVTGCNQENNQYIKQAYDKGHTIGLHTYTHSYSTLYASIKAYFDDLNKVSDMVKELTGEAPKYIRFPGGSSNTVSIEYKESIMTALTKQVIDRGYQYYDWNVSSEDASGNNVDVNRIVNAATSNNSGNLIILMHDGRAKDTTVEALPQIIEYYKNLGFEFRAIDDTSYVCHHGINN